MLHNESLIAWNITWQELKAIGHRCFSFKLMELEKRLGQKRGTFLLSEPCLQGDGLIKLTAGIVAKGSFDKG